MSGTDVPKSPAEILDLRQHGHGDTEKAAKIAIPLAAMDVEQRRARGVGGIGGVDGSSGHAPEQIAVHGAEGEFASFRPRPRTWDVIEEPGGLGCREVGIEQQPRASGKHGLVAFGLEARANVRRAPVLPDDGIVDRASAGPLPDHGGFALVGDADGCDIRRPDAGLGHGIAHGRNRRAPEVFWIVLDQARSRIALRKLFLRHSRDGQIGAENDSAGGGGPLVQGEDEGHNAMLQLWPRRKRLPLPAVKLPPAG